MGMSDYDVDRQVRQMIRFIQQEANEKAEEIDAKSEEDYNVEKTRLIQEQRRKLEEQYERRRLTNEMNRKINTSQMHNAARMLILQDRDEHMEKVRENARDKLINIISRGDEYKMIMEGLMTQCLCQLIEDNVEIRCREQDRELVKSVLPSSSDAYKKMSKKQLHADVDSKDYLKPTIAGGIEMLSQQGKIKVVNTIESRLDMMYQQMLPELRDILFGPNENRKFFD